MSHENLTLVKGDIYNPKSLAPIFKGHDVIISVLEFPKQAEKIMVKFTETMDSILKDQNSKRYHEKNRRNFG